MKLEVSIEQLRKLLWDSDGCSLCKYKGTSCLGRSCEDSKLETLIEKSKLVLDFDVAILELEKLKRKCTEKQIEGLLFAIEKLEEIKKEFQQ
jgi:hypothetical protein